jgi:hypothetical protein
MAIAFRRAKGVREHWRVLFGKPDDIDPRIRLSLERKFSYKEVHISYSPALLNYIRFQTLLSLFILFGVILFEHYLSGPKLFLFSVFILLSVITTGSMLEQRRWIFHLEFARVGILGLLLWVSFPYFNLIVFMAGLALLILTFYRSIGKRYYAYLYK